MTSGGRSFGCPTGEMPFVIIPIPITSPPSILPVFSQLTSFHVFHSLQCIPYKGLEIILHLNRNKDDLRL